MIKPLVGSNFAYGLIPDSVNLIGLTLWEMTYAYYNVNELKIEAAMLPQKQGCRGPMVIFPWYTDLSTVRRSSSVFKYLLCSLKQLCSDRRLVCRGDEPTFLSKIKGFTSLMQLEQFITASLREQPAVYLQVGVRFTMEDFGFECVFSYASCLKSRVSTLDGGAAKRIDRFVETWLSPGYCSNFLVSKYNFPVTLYFSKRFTEGFCQISEQLRIAKSLPLQARSVAEFIDTIRGDLFSEFVQAYRNHIHETTRLRYYEKRKCQSEFNQVNKIIKSFGDHDMAVPDDLVAKQQSYQQKLESRVGPEVDEAQMRCLRAVFETKMIPQFLSVCSEDLEKTLVTYKMQAYDPKLPHSFMFRQFMDFIKTQRLIQSERVTFFDTVWLSDEAELSFLLTAMYVSKQLLKRKSDDELVRDYANLLLFGESGTGKTYTLEALSLLLRVCRVSAPTVQAMFSGKPCFGERSMATSSCMLAHEVSMSSFIQPDAKEYLDVSLEERKVNVKYSQPVSISRGVPFLMATNDFLSDHRSAYFQATPKNGPGIEGMMVTKPQVIPVLRRLTMIPFIEGSGSWLKTKSYVRDFSLLTTEVPRLDHHLPYALTLMAVSLMFYSRVSDFLQTPDDVQQYAFFQKKFEKTFIGMRIKHMPERQMQELENLYARWCNLTSEGALLYCDVKEFCAQRFSGAAIGWQAHQYSFSQTKAEFQAEYMRLYSKFVDIDAVQRIYHKGYSQESYQAVLLKAYSIAIFKTYRLCKKNQLTVSRDYVQMIRDMNQVKPSVPREVAIDSQVEGRRNYLTLPDGQTTFGVYDKRLSVPVLEFFYEQSELQAVCQIDIKDYDTDSSGDDTFKDRLLSLQKRRFMYSAYSKQGGDAFKRQPLQHCDSRVVDEGHVLIGVGENRRSKKLFDIEQSPLVYPKYAYNSDDQTGQNEKLLKRMEERNPMQMRAVPLCKNCKLVKQSVKQSYKIIASIGQRRQMNRPLPRRCRKGLETDWLDQFDPAQR